MMNAARTPPYITRRSWELYDRYYHWWSISRRRYLGALKRMKLLDLP